MKKRGRPNEANNQLKIVKKLKKILDFLKKGYKTATEIFLQNEAEINEKSNFGTKYKFSREYICQYLEDLKYLGIADEKEGKWFPYILEKRGAPDSKKLHKQSEIIEKLKVVLKILKKGYNTPKKIFLQKEAKSRFSERTGYRYLQALNLLGIADEKEGKWYPRFIEKKYKSKEDRDIALDHSRDLVIGLKAILSEGKESDSKALKNEARGGKIKKKYAEKHLKTSNKYSGAFKKLRKYRQFLNTVPAQLKNKYSQEIIQFVEKGIPVFPAKLSDFSNWPWKWDAPIPEDLAKIIESKLDAYTDLEREIRIIEEHISLGEPLDGFCSACRYIKTSKD